MEGNGVRKVVRMVLGSKAPGVCWLAGEGGRRVGGQHVGARRLHQISSTVRKLWGIFVSRGCAEEESLPSYEGPEAGPG